MRNDQREQNTSEKAKLPASNPARKTETSEDRQDQQ